MKKIGMNVATGIALYKFVGTTDFPCRDKDEIEHAGKKEIIHQLEQKTDVKTTA